MTTFNNSTSENNSLSFSPEQIESLKDDLKSKLRHNDAQTLRKILVFFHENFKAQIVTIQNKTDYFKSRISNKYGNSYLKIINEAESNLPNNQLVKSCIDFISDLYFDKIQFKFDPLSQIILDAQGNIEEGKSFDKKKVEKITTGESYYILHYWKTEAEYESNGKINIAKLKIDSSWKTADLNFKSNSDPENTSTGKITEVNSAASGQIIKIVFPENTEKPLSLAISFFLPQVADLRKHIWASYTKERKLKRGTMASGSAYLLRFEDKDQWNEYFINPSELDNGIHAYLINNRIDLPQTTVDNITGLGNLSSILSEFEGIYRGHLIHLNEKGSSFNNFIIVLKKNGKVVIYTARAKEFPYIIYVGYYRVINIEGNKFVIIDYDYNKLESNRFSHFNKYYNFRFVLQRENDNWLLGTRIAINRPTGTPVVSRLALNKLSEKDVEIDDFFSKETENVQNFLKKEGNLGGISIYKSEKINPEIISFFQRETNSFLCDFFLGKQKQFSYSDSNVLNLIANNLPITQIELPINGEFECYSFTLRGNKRIFQYTIEEAVFLMYPLKIEKNGNVFIKVGRNTHQGRAYFNSDKKELLINFTTSIFLSAIFTLLDIEGDFYSDRISGTLIKNTGAGGNPEGRVCVLIKKDNAYSNNINKKLEDIPFDSSNFIFIDKETNGALSYLTGPVNRIARGVNDGKETTQFRGNSSFKKDMFYAACYLAQKENHDTNSVKKRLLQSYLHGFAQTFHRGEEVEKTHDSAFEKLRLERKELLEAMNNGPLNKEVYKKYIEELWINDNSAKKLNRIFGCEQREKVLIVKPNFRREDIAGKAILFAKNDADTIEIIKSLFTNSRLNSPDVVDHNDPILNKESAQKTHYILIGLFSNELTAEINETSVSDCNRYFYFQEIKENESHKIMIADIEKTVIVSNIAKWKSYQLDADCLYQDFFIISKVDFRESKAFICGGLKEVGTIKAGEYLKENWEKLYEMKDSKTNICIKDGRNFVCLFGVLKNTDEVKLIEIRVL